MAEEETADYLETARAALRILKIEYDDAETVDQLCDILESSALIPAASSTELAIRDVSKKLTMGIRNRRDLSELTKLLDRLYFEVTFLPFD